MQTVCLQKVDEIDKIGYSLKRIEMKFKYLIAALLLSVALFSCIRAEAPNAEADIVACTVPGDILKREPIIENNKITLMVRADADLTRQAPEFELTPGASISPVSGTILDFTQPQYYTVTSEDGNWTKKYLVAYVVAGISTEYHFENVRQENSVILNYTYDIFFEKDEDGSDIMEWASGNKGFALTGMGSNASSFPTCSVENGKVGKGVKLETRTTGSWGAALKMYIAAGNLFIGTFDVGSALTNALKATQFGLPFDKVPTNLRGYYKYKAGPVYSEMGQVVDGKKDNFDIYAIFYETDANTKTLDGTNRFDHPNLISIARIADKDRVETNEWTEFNIPFVTLPGKVIDKDKLKANKYNMAIVFSSSIDGDSFKGAVGSILYIDEVELETSPEY